MYSYYLKRRNEERKIERSEKKMGEMKEERNERR